MSNIAELAGRLSKAQREVIVCAWPYPDYHRQGEQVSFCPVWRNERSRIAMERKGLIASKADGGPRLSQTGLALRAHPPSHPGATQMTNRADMEALAGILRERASYLRAMVPEGLSQIERQSMEAMDTAANEIDRLTSAIRSAWVTLNKRPEFAEQLPAFFSHILSGGTTQEFDAALRAHAATKGETDDR